MTSRLLPLLLFIGWLLPMVAASTESRPNVLFIAIDDLNNSVGFLNNYPGIKTPNLDRLAQEGFVFSNAHCAAPACAPSRAAVFTGIAPANSGVYTNKHNWLENPITQKVSTITDSFQTSGYLTKGGGKLYHAHTLVAEAHHGFIDPEPWDTFFPDKQTQLPPEITPPGEWPVNGHPTYYKRRFDWAALDIPDDQMGDGQVVAWAEKQLLQAHGKPLFLGVGIYRPHIPWWTPKKYFDLYPLDEIELPNVPASDLSDLPEAALELNRDHWHRWITENNQWKKAVQGYLASVSFADAMVGRLLAALEKGPMAGNTIIVLWSDHGYHLGHKHHWEKFALWEQATQVPLVFADTREGGISSGRSAYPASLLDIYPTLLELCKLPKVDNLDGESLVPIFQDSNLLKPRGVVTTHGYKNHAVRDTRWRYIRYADGSEELYDHDSDPDEFQNLARKPEYRETILQLEKWLPKFNQP